MHMGVRVSFHGDAPGGLRTSRYERSLHLQQEVEQLGKQAEQVDRKESDGGERLSVSYADRRS